MRTPLLVAKTGTASLIDDDVPHALGRDWVHLGIGEGGESN
ncbi:hypothetical protein [Microcoleus sp. FACHB-SPT15]|nr:hypothetical protein [Microcoleus sp. FACHB-SPT15]